MLMSMAKEAIGLLFRIFLFKIVVRKGSLIIFMFHRILPEEGIDPFQENLFTTPRRFENQILAIRKAFTIVDIHEWIKNPLTEARACAITFDDGWVDNYVHAFPILKMHKLPATIFICTSMIGTSKRFWFDRLSHICKHITREELASSLDKTASIDQSLFSDRKRLFTVLCASAKEKHREEIEEEIGRMENVLKTKPGSERSVLNWNEVKELSQNGISFGSHCVNHTVLTSLQIGEAIEEMKESYQELEAQDLCFVPIISFPNGNYSDEILTKCGNIGYIAALTASYVQWKRQENIPLFPRLAISNRTSANSLFFDILRILKPARRP